VPGWTCAPTLHRRTGRAAKAEFKDNPLAGVAVGVALVHDKLRRRRIECVRASVELIVFPAHARLILEERLAEQEVQAVEMPEGMERDELALRILIAASRPSLRQSPPNLRHGGTAPSWKRGLRVERN
jgi:hypothetical protein